MAPTTAVVPIQSLDTSIPPPAGRTIRAVVTLCWPYSSSTRQCALLLADPDFRLRSRKGQVRVRFHGAAAEAVAKAKPGIGDEVELELGGAGWVGSGVGGEIVQTPGKSVGELEYHGAVRLRLSREGGSIQNVFVEKDVVNGQAHAQVHALEVPQTAPVRSHIPENPRTTFRVAPITSSTYSSPAFLHRTRFAEDNLLDRLLAEDLDGDGSPRKRVRVSIGEVRDWRVVSRTSSPVKEHSPAKPVSSPLELNTSRDGPSFPSVDGHTDKSSPSNGREMSVGPTPAPRPISVDIEARTMLPPTLPRLQVPESHSRPDHGMEENDEPTTPRLLPISSAKLTAPSPFPTEVVKQSLAPPLREIPDTYAEDDEMVDADPANTTGDDDNLEHRSHPLWSPSSVDQDNVLPNDGTAQHMALAPADASSKSDRVEDIGNDSTSLRQDAVPGEPAVSINDGLDESPIKDAEVQRDFAASQEGDDTQSQVSSSIVSNSVAVRNEDHNAATGKDPQSVANADLSTSSTSSQSPSPVQQQPLLRPQQPALSRKIVDHSLNPTGYFKSGWDKVVPAGRSTFASGWNGSAGLDATSTTVGRHDHLRLTGADKVLKGAFRSLFGFPGTPSPTKEDPPSLPVRHDGANDDQADGSPHTPAEIPQEGLGARESSPAGIPQFDGPAVSRPSVFGWKVASFQELLSVNEPPSRLLSPADASILDSAAEVTEDLPEADDLAQRIEEPDLPKYNGQPPASTAQSAVDVIDLGSSSDAEDPLRSPARAVSRHAAPDQSSPYVPSSPAPFDFGSALESVETGDEVDEPDYDAFVNEPDDDSEQEDDRSRLASLAVQSIATAGSNAMTPILPDDVESVATARDATSVRGSSCEPMILEGSATPVYASGTASLMQEIEDDSQPLAYPQLPGSSPVQLDQPPLTSTTADSSFQQITSSPLAQLRHSPAHDIEMLDLSQQHVNEYAAPSHGQPQLFSQLSQRSNRVAVEDSIDSPETTLIDETSSRPGSGHSMDQSQASQGSLMKKARPQQRSHTMKSVSASPSTSTFGAADEGHVAPPTKSVDEDALSTDEASHVPHGPDDTSLVDNEVVNTVNANLPDPELQTVDLEDQQPAPVLDAQAPSDVLQRLFGITESFESVTDTAENPAPTRAGLTSLEVSYPRLPFTPSFSQSQSFGFETQLRPPDADLSGELQTATELPPTPQLTQQLSGLAQSAVSQNGEHTGEIDQLSAADNRNEVAKPHDIAQEDVVETLPDALQTQKPAMQLAEVVLQPDETVEQVTAPFKTPHRKSVTARLSHVPEVISAWFSPKSSKASSAIKSATNGHATPATGPSLLAPQLSQITGLRTPHAYFPALSSLTSHLNTPSQTPASTVDLLAVITSVPTSPQRAKTGPRDYYTTFRISDPSLPLDSKGARVEVFRHWKAVLPTGELGDVVLLRAFVVKGLKGGAVGLRASGEGAWCVWRFGEMERFEKGNLGEKNDGLDGGRPRSGSLGVREEVKGPPVEFGEAERQRAQELREWWTALPKIGRAGLEQEDVDV
ncbi:hypothetical protein B0A48_00929 [Cryoendolithus antarcticus]|uniref:Telomeric single stranded DNA binding POT1/Cdc13 domain-containing protein n=1 Tax=Cryoendolithus antarcticus TaxID=1507870 RepID=A0A1V8TRQ6_9PEZI|nr:hypothetical protein B0A48_00929 [Cryoendolithus antarcticus]